MSGVDLKQIHFVVGGSALNMLNEQQIDTDTKYVVQRYRNMIFVVKHKPSVQNYADIGFQFERLVCGGKFEDKHDLTIFEHMQILEIGEHRVFMSAEVDGTTEERLPVEIKANNPSYWGYKTTLQMVSSGSTFLVHGRKKGKTQLVGIDKWTLDQVVKKAGSKDSWARVQAKILQGLDSLALACKDLDEDKIYEIIWNGGLKVVFLNEKIEILPQKEVIHELLGY